MSIRITTKDALVNLTSQAGNTKRAALLLTASIVIVHSTYAMDDKEQAKARDAIRANFITNGFVKIDKGTKQPNDKARRFSKCAESAVVNYPDSVAVILEKHDTIEAQTNALADWIESFAFTNNHYEGGVYIMCLTLAISKSEAKKRIAASKAKNQPIKDSDKTVVPAVDEESASPGNMPNAKKVVTRAMQVAALVPSLLAMLAVPATETPSLEDSNAVIIAMTDLDTAFRMVRGETVKSASKQAGKLSVLLGRFVKAQNDAAKASTPKNTQINRKAVKKAA